MFLRRLPGATLPPDAGTPRPGIVPLRRGDLLAVRGSAGALPSRRSVPAMPGTSRFARAPRPARHAPAPGGAPRRAGRTTSDRRPSGVVVACSFADGPSTGRQVGAVGATLFSDPR